MKTFEIQIPVYPNPDTPFEKEKIRCDTFAFTEEHHQTFFDVVLNASGGYSVLPKIRGCWKDDGEIYGEKMIPVRIACTDEQIEQIAKFAKVHYEQISIFVLEIGTARFF